ncbi:hypothetical protein CLOM_g14510 [Closterium sp. NIES-68]|nr:hypothetical protein CLOM_g14510 [Closterium sp. NIES-68]
MDDSDICEMSLSSCESLRFPDHHGRLTDLKVITTRPIFSTQTVSSEGSQKLTDSQRCRTLEYSDRRLSVAGRDTRLITREPDSSLAPDSIPPDNIKPAFSPHPVEATHSPASAPASRASIPLKAKSEKIFVSVRVRPLNRKEAASGDQVVWRIQESSTLRFLQPLPERSPYPAAYTFDRAFGPDCPSSRVYEEGAKNIVLSALAGINASIFAYGMTSSGKTYTMQAVTDLAACDIFMHIQNNPHRSFLVKLSAIEIYNEIVRDLLSPDSGPLRLLDDPERGTVVERLTEVEVESKGQLERLLVHCAAQREVGETSLNDASSRSHQIIRLLVESCPSAMPPAPHLSPRQPATSAPADAAAAQVLSASLNFVDLAGSERASQTHVAGTRLKEGCHINRSLLTLATVIRKLSMGSRAKAGHIPYRDSKLTRILQQSLGGNGRTAIITTISAGRTHLEQTRNTLAFALRAKEVTNSACVNVVVTDRALVEQLQREVARLEGEMRLRPSREQFHEQAVRMQQLEEQLSQAARQQGEALARVQELSQALSAAAGYQRGSHARRRAQAAWQSGKVHPISSNNGSGSSDDETDGWDRFTPTCFPASQPLDLVMPTCFPGSFSRRPRASRQHREKNAPLHAAAAAAAAFPAAEATAKSTLTVMAGNNHSSGNSMGMEARGEEQTRARGRMTWEESARGREREAQWSRFEGEEEAQQQGAGQLRRERQQQQEKSHGRNRNKKDSSHRESESVSLQSLEAWVAEDCARERRRKRKAVSAKVLALMHEIQRLEQLQDALGDDVGRAMGALQGEMERMRARQNAQGQGQGQGQDSESPSDGGVHTPASHYCLSGLVTPGLSGLLTPSSQHLSGLLGSSSRHVSGVLAPSYHHLSGVLTPNLSSRTASGILTPLSHQISGLLTPSLASQPVSGCLSAAGGAAGTGSAGGAGGAVGAGGAGDADASAAAPGNGMGSSAAGGTPARRDGAEGEPDSASPDSARPGSVPPHSDLDSLQSASLLQLHAELSRLTVNDAKEEERRGYKRASASASAAAAATADGATTVDSTKATPAAGIVRELQAAASAAAAAAGAATDVSAAGGMGFDIGCLVEPSGMTMRSSSQDLQRMEFLFRSAAEANVASIRTYVSELKEIVAKLHYQKQLLVKQVVELEAARLGEEDEDDMEEEGEEEEEGEDEDGEEGREMEEGGWGCEEDGGVMERAQEGRREVGANTRWRPNVGEERDPGSREGRKQQNRASSGASIDTPTNARPHQHPRQLTPFAPFSEGGFREEVMETVVLWDRCQVSLIRRTQLFLVLMQGEPSDRVYLQVERRRLEWLVRHAGEEGKAAREKELRKEREYLARRMAHCFTLHQRLDLFHQWGVATSSRQRKRQLAVLLWSRPANGRHVEASARIVGRLTGMIESSMDGGQGGGGWKGSGGRDVLRLCKEMLELRLIVPSGYRGLMSKRQRKWF